MFVNAGGVYESLPQKDDQSAMTISGTMAQKYISVGYNGPKRHLLWVQWPQKTFPLVTMAPKHLSFQYNAHKDISFGYNGPQRHVRILWVQLQQPFRRNNVQPHKAISHERKVHSYGKSVCVHNLVIVSLQFPLLY